MTEDDTFKALSRLDFYEADKVWDKLGAIYNKGFGTQLYDNEDFCQEFYEKTRWDAKKWFAEWCIRLERKYDRRRYL